MFGTRSRAGIYVAHAEQREAKHIGRGELPRAYFEDLEHTRRVCEQLEAQALPLFFF